MDEETEKLRLIIDTTTFGPRQQLIDVDELDGKVTQIFAAASVVIGLTALLSSVAGGRTVTSLIIAASVAYAICAGAAIFALYPRNFRGAHMANSLLPWSGGKSLRDVEIAIAETIPEAWDLNARGLAPKQFGLTVALAACATEVGLIAIALVSSRIIGA